MQAIFAYAALSDFSNILQAHLRTLHEKKPDAMVKFITQSQSGQTPERTMVSLTIFYEDPSSKEGPGQGEPTGG